MLTTRYDSRQVAVLAGAGSAALLLAALGFQAAGYVPCELCVLQRWPHVAAALIGAAILFTHWQRWLGWLGLLAALLATALAIYHTGVEWKWWPGPTACTGGVQNLASMSAADLVRQLNTTAVVRCDQPALVVLGLSMAGWNAIASAVLSAMWVWTLGRGRAPGQARA